VTQAQRTTATLVVLLALLLVGAVVGWRQLTAPLPTAPQASEEGPCEMVRVSRGSPVRPGMVVVSVYNAGTRSGLAGKTLEQLIRRGFAPGVTGNADRELRVPVAQVWTTDKGDPAAQLVRRHLGRARLLVKPEGQVEGDGVMVVVGDGFKGLAKKGPAQVTATQASTVCSPTAQQGD